MRGAREHLVTLSDLICVTMATMGRCEALDPPSPRT